MKCPNCGEEFPTPGNRALGNFFGMVVSILIAAGVVAIILALIWKILEAML